MQLEKTHTRTPRTELPHNWHPTSREKGHPHDTPGRVGLKASPSTAEDTQGSTVAAISSTPQSLDSLTFLNISKTLHSLNFSKYTSEKFKDKNIKFGAGTVA